MSGVNVNDQDMMCAESLAALGSSTIVGPNNSDSEEGIGSSTAVPEKEGAARETSASE